MNVVCLILFLFTQTIYAKNDKDIKDDKGIKYVKSVKDVSTKCTLAFPEAEGFGACAKGGTGGKVLEVTTLEDNDSPGSFRWATEIMKGPRIVKFTVEGIITLKKNITITNPYLTIDGSTAPGGGITLRDGTVGVVDTNDIIIRYIRVRPGDSVALKKGIWSELKRSEWPGDAIHIINTDNAIIDHVSASWSSDEVITVKDSQNVTVQWSIMTEPLANPKLHIENDKKISHPLGSIMSGNGISFIKNMYSNYEFRGPQMEVSTSKNFSGNQLLTSNNIIAFYSKSGSKIEVSADDVMNLAVVNNFYQNYAQLKSPAIQIIYAQNSKDSASKGTQLYIAGNVLSDGSVQDVEKWNGVAIIDVSEKDIKEIKSLVAPFPFPNTTIINGQDLKKELLPTIGASLPVRDTVDTRIINQLENNKGEIIFSQDVVGGYDNLYSSSKPGRFRQEK